MQFLRRMMAYTVGQPQLPLFLQEQLINGTDSLPFSFYDQAIGDYDSKPERVRLFSQVIASLQKAQSPPATIKILTLIFKTLIANNFEQDFLDQLPALENPNFQFSQQMKAHWLKQLCVCCKSYMMRLPSLGSFFSRQMNKPARGDLPVPTLLSDLFLVINVLNLLFPFLTNTLNTIGRYYLKTNPYFKQFYKAIAEHLYQHYEYLRFISNHIVQNYKQIQTSDLNCFIKTVPEIQILCDKMEQALLNKYFKGRAPGLKIYFKEEEIEEINYFLRCSSKRDISETKTAEDEFQEYQS